jgi:NAD(P)H-dependent FMN reductase
MPVALLDASGRSRHVGEQLREVLSTMSAVVVEAASVTVVVQGADADLQDTVPEAADLAILRRALSSLGEAAARRTRLE